MLTENTFAAACYEQNSLAELIYAFNNLPDRTDMKTWGLTKKEYYAALQQAIEERLADTETSGGKKEYAE